MIILCNIQTNVLMFKEASKVKYLYISIISYDKKFIRQKFLHELC
jgi:hypothetical protein